MKKSNLLWIRPLAAIYHPPYKKCSNGCRVRYANAYAIYAPFYCISLKNDMGGITLPGVWFQGILPKKYSFDNYKIRRLYNRKISKIL